MAEPTTDHSRLTAHHVVSVHIESADVQINAKGPEARGLVRLINFSRPEVITAQRPSSGKMTIIDDQNREHQLVIVAKRFVRDQHQPTVHYPLYEGLRDRL